jgi:tRNA-uridine 2-sulfurtransferase
LVGALVIDLTRFRESQCLDSCFFFGKKLTGRSTSEMAIKNELINHFSRSDKPRIDMTDESEWGSRIVVAMSGGVDSSVAALLLAEQGRDIVGVSMQVWDYRSHGGCASKATCCSPDDFTDARKVASRINIPYYVFDFEDTFREKVINKFVDAYLSGETPNPCIECNNKVKFRELRDRAVGLGASVVATGHYAQIVTGPDKVKRLTRGADRLKDQSYFLYRMKPEELERTLFPVGHLHKERVRELAHGAGLSTASKPESQDICFISDSAHAFVSRVSRRDLPKGIIKTSDGRVLGTHEGIHRFTVGQRRGLGIGGLDDPLYVIEIDPLTHTVFVGGRSELRRTSFLVKECSWLSPDILPLLCHGVFPYEFSCIVQARSRHQGSRVKVSVLSPSDCEVEFVDEWVAVSPGQAAVFFDNENHEVLGGGEISLSDPQEWHTRKVA